MLLQVMLLVEICVNFMEGSLEIRTLSKELVYFRNGGAEKET